MSSPGLPLKELSSVGYFPLSRGPQDRQFFGERGAGAATRDRRLPTPWAPPASPG